MDPKKKQSIIEILKGEDEPAILAALNEIQENGDIEILRAILEQLYNTDNQKIVDEILFLLYDVKLVDALPLYVDFITNDIDNLFKKDLITVCWQSGIDCSAFLSFFVDLAIEEEFMTAFEAVTVIENFTTKLDNDVIDENITKLENAAQSASKDKVNLLESLAITLRNFKKGEYPKFYSEN